jgi:hypothetical protein
LLQEDARIDSGDSRGAGQTLHEPGVEAGHELLGKRVAGGNGEP